MTEGCHECSADALATERVVEHQCGHMDARSAFEEGCPKCGGPTDESTFEAVDVVERCTVCGHWQAPAPSGDSSPVDVTFPDLPALGQSLTWLPAWLVPSSERRRQLLSSAILVVVLTAGVAGALATSPLLEETPDAAEVNTDPDWEEYDSISIFRNDDIQPWYNTEEMRAVDDVFIEAEVPVTLGVIPNPGGDLPLTDDEATCAYLGELQATHPGGFEMALHGYTHAEETGFYDGSEFGELPYEEQADRIADGEAILSQCVDPSRTFIPPMNTYDANTTRALAEANYTTVSGGTWFTEEYYEPGNDTDDFVAGDLHHVPETQAFEDWSAHDGSGDVPFEETETLIDSFDETHAEGGVHVQMLHYQYFTTEERLDQLRDLVEHMRSTDGVAFMTLGQFSQGVESGAIERTDDGWRVLEPIEYTATDDELRAAASENATEER